VIAYLPFTLAPVLTNMRYSVTVQPLMFMFTAVALVALAAFPARLRGDDHASHSS
jgi:hypothetical protein